MKIFNQCLLAVSILFCTVLSYSENSIVIVTNDYEPYTSSKNGGSGVMLEIIQQAFNEVDLKVTFKFYPWKRGQRELDKGLVFAAAPYFKTKERQEIYDFSDPILPMFNRWFYNTENFPEGFEWSELSDFQGYNIGGILGFWYISALEESGVSPELVKNDMQNLRKLATQRIDFTIIDELTGNGLIREHMPSKIKIIKYLDKPFDVQESHLLISRSYPNSEEITKQFNKGLEILKGNGKFWQILITHEVPTHFRQSK
ncbi:MAG: transporter substrate-binding domain-containing protein [Oleispira sp.]|nr:transporter substrate-binding domain-containing protein [Oleispira sp.]MBL4879944.1 transporter substrate-binding domain-containing protein [Oleispira sp.]